MQKAPSQIRLPGTPTQFFLLLVVASSCCLFAWYAYALYVSKYSPELIRFVPSPIVVAETGAEMMGTESFWSAVLRSNLRVLAGFTLSAVFAIPLGIWLGAYPRYRGLVGPVTDFARYVPVAAIVPLTILWAGTGESVKVIVLFVGTFFQLLVMVSDDVRRVPLEMVESALTLGAKSRHILSRVLLPAAGPSIFDSLRVAVGFTWSYLTIAEIVAAEKGLGYILIHSQRFLRTPQMFVVIIVLGVLGLVYDQCFVLSRRYLFRWAQEERAA